ncbi:MAG: TIGR04255 family protein [Mariprofundales bacterium]
MKYINPTIVEALCEFRFTLSEAWDSTLYGALWNVVKDEYPNKEERKQMSMAFQVINDGNQEPPTISEVSHMLFKTEDEKSLIQL